MATYDRYFTTYQSLNPPPVKSRGYQDIESFYRRMQDLPETGTEEEETDVDEGQGITARDDAEPATRWVPADWRDVSLGGRQEPASGSALDGVIRTARAQRGKRYVWGGTSPSSGFDCSGLIRYAYMQNGIELPRTVQQMEHAGREVSLADVQPGDIICMKSKSGRHAKLVTEVGGGKIWTIEAKGKNYGVVEDLLTDTQGITSIRRVYGQQSSMNPIIGYFMQKGLTENQARGIYGNIMQESRGNISAVSDDGYASYGLAQWTGSRKKELFKRYGTRPTQQQQLDFLWWELNNSHKDTLDKLRGTSTVDDAVKVVMDGYERPHPAVANLRKRLMYAKS